jgi:hypothetical protein
MNDNRIASTARPLAAAWIGQLGAIAVMLLATTTAVHLVPASLFVRISGAELVTDAHGAPVLRQQIAVLPFVVSGLSTRATLFVADDTGGESVVSPCGHSHECGSIGLLLEGSLSLAPQPVADMLRSSGCVLEPGLRYFAVATHRFTVLGMARQVSARTAMMSIPPSPQP